MNQETLRRSARSRTRGLRERRNHDARLLEWVTRGPPGDVIDGYTTLPWETFCQQIVCIKVDRTEGKVINLPRSATAGGGAPREPVVGDSRAQVAHRCC